MYAVVGVLCIHNPDCGNAVDPPHIHIWAVELWRMCDKCLTDLHVHMP